jgi:FixJ family two-component response regulator
MIDRLDPIPTIYMVIAESRRFDQVQTLLAEKGRFNIRRFASLQQFVQAYRLGQPGCLLIEFGLASTGAGLCEELAARAIDLPIVVVASNASLSDCAATMRAGAFDFIDLVELDHRLLASVRAAVQQDAAQHEKWMRRAAIQARIGQLTVRERETLDLVLEGLSTKQIASRFGIRFQTAAKHHARLLRKMAVHNDVQLVRLCMANGMPQTLSNSPLPKRRPRRSVRHLQASAAAKSTPFD